MKTEQIELTNREIAFALEALQRIESADVELDMKFTIAKNQKRLRQANEDYEEFKLSVLKEHCQLNGQGYPETEGNRYVFKTDEDEAAATVKNKELGDVSISLDLYIFPLNIFKKAKISHNLLEHLLWMIRSEEEERPAPKKVKPTKEG